MIKIEVRKNLLYPLQIIIWSFFRALERYLMLYFFEFYNLTISTLLMLLGEFIGGLIFYILQKRFLLKHKKQNQIKFVGIGFYKSNESLPADGNLKIAFLIFCATLFTLPSFYLWYKFLNLIIYHVL